LDAQALCRTLGGTRGAAPIKSQLVLLQQIASGQQISQITGAGIDVKHLLAALAVKVVMVVVTV
jgi:hypothetical protein